MLNNPTVEKLRGMKLKVMAQVLIDQDPALRELSFEERLGIMVEKEWLHRKNTRIKRLLYKASLAINACIEDIDYTQERKIDKKIRQKFNSKLFAISLRNIFKREYGFNSIKDFYFETNKSDIDLIYLVGLFFNKVFGQFIHFKKIKL